MKDQNSINDCEVRGGKNVNSNAIQECKAKPVNDVNVVHILGKVLNDKTILETVYDPQKENGSLIIRYPDGRIQRVKQFTHNHNKYLPLIDEQVKKRYVILPSDISSNNDPIQLRMDIQNVIHRHVELEEWYEHICSRYILMSWVYERFDRVPYLRNMGLFGCGKTRTLDILREISYHSSNLGTGFSSAGIYRQLDNYPGTLIIDEADFEGDSNSRLITKILNGGYAKNGCVVRCDPPNYRPRPYSSFGPKIIASHDPYLDNALESRCLTHICFQKSRMDIPISLPDRVNWPEMIDLRNRLLGFRLEYYHKINTNLIIPDLNRYDPRLIETILPLLQVTSETTIPEEVKDFMDKERDNRLFLLSMDDNYQILMEIIEYDGPTSTFTVGEIAKRVNKKRERQYQLSERYVGARIGAMGIDKDKKHNGYIIIRNPLKIKQLATRYGLSV